MIFMSVLNISTKKTGKEQKLSKEVNVVLYEQKRKCTYLLTPY